MRDAIRRFPWFEVLLILGLAAALIMKPQTRALSAPAEGNPSGSVARILPLSTAHSGAF